MNQDKLAALKAAAEAATPGPWRYEYEPGYCGELIAMDGDVLACFVDEPSKANAAYLSCVGPSTILALIERLEAAEKDAARYRATRTELINPDDIDNIQKPCMEMIRRNGSRP